MRELDEKKLLNGDVIDGIIRRFLQHCQGVKAGCFWLTPVQLIEEHCQLRAGISNIPDILI